MPPTKYLDLPSGRIFCIQPCMPYKNLAKHGDEFLDEDANRGEEDPDYNSEKEEEEGEDYERDEQEPGEENENLQWPFDNMWKLWKLLESEPSPRIAVRFGCFQVDGVLSFCGFSKNKRPPRYQDLLKVACNDPSTKKVLRIKDQFGDDAADVLSGNTTITSLQLCSNLDKEQATKLSHNTTITDLTLSGNIDGSAVVALSTNTTITRLQFQTSSFGEEGVKALARNTTIRELLLYHTPITKVALGALVNNTTLSHLTIANTHLGDDGAVALAQTNMPSLDLRSCGVGDEGAKALAASTAITSLGLNGNSNITDEGVVALAQNTNLTCLDVICLKYGDAACQTLACNTSILTLSIHSSKDADWLLKNTTITSLFYPPTEQIRHHVTRNRMKWKEMMNSMGQMMAILFEMKKQQLKHQRVPPLLVYSPHHK